LKAAITSHFEARKEDGTEVHVNKEKVEYIEVREIKVPADE
jgi:hypothetical protein